MGKLAHFDARNLRFLADFDVKNCGVYPQNKKRRGEYKMRLRILYSPYKGYFLQSLFALPKHRAVLAGR